MATTQQIEQLKKLYPNFPWNTSHQATIDSFVNAKLPEITTPEFPESAARVLIINEFTRLKRTYTETEVNNYLTLARLDWRDMGVKATFSGLTEKMRARFNSLPPQETSVVDNQQDYAPVIQSPSTPTTITLPNILNPSSPVTITLTPTSTQTPVTTQPAATTTQQAQTITSISDVTDNAMDYSPAIASTDATVATTTDTASVMQAGISSNTLAIILLIGAALGVIFAMLKGVKK